jgi:hypothetical protein
MLVDAVFARGLVQIIEDRGAVGDRLGLGPGLEREAQGEHVRVGPDAGIAEQVPGPAQSLAPLQDHIAALRAVGLQMIARTHAGNAGAHDHYVEMFGHRPLQAHAYSTVSSAAST